MTAKVTSVFWSNEKGILLGIKAGGDPIWSRIGGPHENLESAPLFNDRQDVNDYLGGIQDREDFPTDVEMRQVPTALGKRMASEEDCVASGMPRWSR